MIELPLRKAKLPGFAPWAAAARSSTYRGEQCSGWPCLPGGPVPPTMAAMTMVGSFRRPGFCKGTSLRHDPGWNSFQLSFILMRKGVILMTMQPIPGAALLTGQVDGQKVGQALFALGPSMPHESPIPMPRFLARALFPQGFIPRLPAVTPLAPPAQLIPPAGIPAAPPAPAPAPPAANQVIRTQPAPRRRVLERGTFPSWQ
ncbi:hypothetical protein ES703_80168 [subsurface metagenome]